MSAKSSDSQDQEDDVAAGSGQGHVGEREPQPLGQKMPDTLDLLMDNLEENLPQVPLPGPDKAQIPSPTRAADTPLVASPPASKPVEKEAAHAGAAPPGVLPTPCRSESTPQLVPQASTVAVNNVGATQPGKASIYTAKVPCIIWSVLMHVTKKLVDTLVQIMLQWVSLILKGSHQNNCPCKEIVDVSSEEEGGTGSGANSARVDLQTLVQAVIATLKSHDSDWF